MSYKIDKSKCIGCGSCIIVCPKGIKFGKDGKAEIINQEEAEKCKAENICPMEAIKKTEDK
jgi:NAD-dependent dihydropyrimidine dehydrogenase PreA subunit